MESHRLMNITEVSHRTGLAKSTIREWCYFRRIPFYKLGRRVLFSPAEIDKWLERAKVPAKEERG